MISSTFSICLRISCQSLVLLICRDARPYYDSRSIEEFTHDDGHKLGPTEIYEFLSRVMYSRRSKMDPLWNSLLVGGVKDGKRLVQALLLQPPLSSQHFFGIPSFLGYVDLLGTTYQASTLATGYGAHIAQPLLRKAVEGNEHTLTEDEGIAILDNAMKVLFYRDARSINKVRASTPLTSK